ncbi:glioma pathogenesis-related protein 1 [Genypterus blacodes]|uniref:glioma pathogenesis-related protein 1 n=1 Tax=Genypterus blacodes TaxID=154954 RepID=UPI003F767ACF
MQRRSLSELQGVPLQQETSTLGTAQRRVSVLSSALGSLPQSSKVRRWSVRCLCPQKRAPLWAWLLLGVLLVPGTLSFLTEEQEELLVELHNHYRGQVSPHASAMLPLKWDASLKMIAEGYAAKCHWSHNPELEETGENLFAGTGPLDLRVALEQWFMEYLNYDYHNNSCHDDKMCGHYTQMVWADTHRVGCAFHLCSTMEGLDWGRASFLVCNYYPAGNYEDEKPYQEGDSCSRCPENLQKCENKLCVADNEEEEEEEEEEKNMKVVPPPATSKPLTQFEAAPHQSTPRTTTTFSSIDPIIPHLDHPRPPGEEEKREEGEDEEEKRKKYEEEEPRDRRRMKSSSSSSSLSVLLVSLTAILILTL